MQANDADTETEVDHVEYGTVEHADPGPALDGTWDTFMTDRSNVAFAWGFEDTPSVVIEPADETVPGIHRAINVSTTGFDSRWMVYGEESAGVDGHWAAFGPASESRLWHPWLTETHGEPGSPLGNLVQRLVIETLHDYDELVAALARIEWKSQGRVTVESAGKSNQGRDIFHATAGEGDTHVVLVGEQHGDEATGCEALLNLLERLADGGRWVDSLLSELTIHAIPRANPDGVAYGDYRHRYNVDPNAPARRSSEGIYTAYAGGEIGWDVNRYHWYDWTESTLYQHRPEQYPENPVPEAQILVETIHEIDPLWVADLHNQYYYVVETEDGGSELVTSSLGWPTVSDADPEAVDLAKRLCRSVYDDVDPGRAAVTQYPGSDVAGIARNSYAREGIASLLVEMRGQTDDYGQLSSRSLIRSAYQIVLSLLVRTADESVFDVDPAAAEEIPERGDRYEVSLHPEARSDDSDAESVSAEYYDHAH